MCGSILVLPGSVFLWKVRHPKDLTVDSIAPPLQLYLPKLEYLFIGSPYGAGSIDPVVLNQIRNELQQSDDRADSNKGKDDGRSNIVVDPMDLTNAMGTFNILNGEDRRVGAALILPPDEDNSI